MQIGNHPIDKAYAELIKPVRNRMRLYNYDSLLDTFLRRLNKPLTDNKVTELQKLPWVVERLVLWLLADNSLHYKKAMADERAIDFLIHMAWNSVDKLHIKHIQVRSVKLFVRQLFLSQIPYQISLDSHSLSLQLYLISNLDKNSKLKKYLNNKAGMPIEQYFQIALLFWAHTNAERPWFSVNYIKSVLPIFSEKNLNIFINSITSSKHVLQNIFSQRTIELDEWFQPVILYKTPCILHENTITPFGRPTLRRYFENLVGNWFEDENNQCLQDYDNLISKYVEFGLQRCKANFLDEDGIKKLTNTKKRICDFLIDDKDCYILLEVKNKSLTKKMPSSSHPVPIKSKLKSTIVSAIQQLDDTMNELASLPKFNSRKCYKIIVTKNDLWLGDLSALFPVADGADPIWLLSLADIDNLVELVTQGKATFSSFFRDVVERQKTAEHSVFSVGMLFDKPEYRLESLPLHLIAETDKIFHALMKKLNDK